MMSASRTGVRGQVVVITGGARGIGLATATALHALGAKVAVGDIDELAVKTAATSAGLDFYGKLDVTDLASFAGFLDDVESQLGSIDVLVNNAGIMPIGRIVDEPDEVTRRILDINVYGVIIGSKLAENATPGLATYSASKHAVLGFTDSVRIEHRGSGVHFSILLPTFTNTELVAGTSGPKGFTNAEPEDIAAGIVALIAKPKRRVTVTRAAGLLSSAMNLVPAAAKEFIARTVGMEEVFLGDVDSVSRKTYEDRARGITDHA
jgi:NAD(P)-dependent dehydrogenase (short-subunit alcohol dehydrogenase family)